MHSLRKLAPVFSAVLLATTRLPAAPSTNTFTVAAYNIENWNEIERSGRPNQPKPASEKEAVWKVLTRVRPDVLGVEEMGKANDFAEFVTGLRNRGLDYPHTEWIQSADADRHVALLSRFPIEQRLSRTDYTYVLDGRSLPVQRGFLDVSVRVNDHYTFRAVVAHLKSKRQSSQGDQAGMRREEAKLLRAHIGKALKDDPQLRLIAMGDFNDTPESESIRTLVGETPFALFDLMPVDSQGRHDTHFWKARDLFSRIDYLITSPAMHADYVEGSARIADVPEWTAASDHRAIYARFLESDRPSNHAGRTGMVPSDILNDRRVWLVALNVVAILLVGGVLLVFVRRHYRSASS